MSKFKVGDRVRVRQNAGFSRGSTGSVTEVGLGAFHYFVHRDGASNSLGFFEEELELLPPEVDPQAALDAACSEVARSISIRQSATESAEQFVRRIWSAVELQRAGGAV